MRRLTRQFIHTHFLRWHFAGFAAAVLIAGLACAGNGFAQGSRKDDIVFNAQGHPMGGATVRVCTSAATGQPCSPLASIYSDAGLTQALANPLSADGMGNYTFYAAPGRYEIEISGPGITTKQLPNVILPSDPSSPTFTTVTTTSGISAFSLSLAGNLTVSGSISVAGTLTIGGLPIPGATVDNQWTANQRFKGPIPWRDVTTFMPSGGCSTTATDAGANTTGTISLGSATTLTLAASKDFKTGCGIAILGAGAAPTIATPPSAITLASVTSSSNIVTVTSTGNHSLVVGSGSGQYQGVQVTGCSNTAYNGTYPIQTIADSTHFTYNTTTSGTGSTTGCTVTVFFGYAHGIAGSTGYTYKIAAIDANMGVTAASTAAVTIANGNATLSKYNYNHLMWANETGTYMWVVYRNSGSGYTCVGTSFGGGFEDMGFNSPCPVFAPSTPPSSTTAEALNTTISAGGGSTTLTLAAAATTGVTAANVYHDESSFVTACVNAVNSDQSAEAGSYGCYLPAGNYWINGEMPTASILPTPGVMKIAVAGSLVFHTIPWFISEGRYDIEGIGGGAQTGSFQHGGYTPIETSVNVPTAVVLVNPSGGTVTFSGFALGDNGLLHGDGILVGGGALSFDNDYITVGAYGAGFRIEGALGVYMNHIGVQGGGSGGLAAILWDSPSYNGVAGCCWYIRDLFTANHGLGFMGPGGNGSGSVYNTLQVTDWLQENMDPLDNGLIQIDTGPNAPGQINGAGFPLLGVGLLNVSNSDVAVQYQNIFSSSSLIGSAPVQSASLVNVQSGGSLAVCVNGAACPLSLVNVFSNSTPPNLSAGFGSSGFAQNRNYGLPTANASNVSLGPTLFAQTFAGGGSYAIPAWAMVLPAPAGLSVTSTGSGSLSAGTYCLGVSGVDSQPSGTGQTNLSNVVCQAVGSSGAINLSWFEGASNSLNTAFSNFDLWYCVESGGVPCSPNNYLLNITTSGLDPVTATFSSTTGGASGTPNANSTAQFSWLSWDWNQTPYSCFFCTARGHSDYWPVGFGMIPTGNAGYNIYTKLGVNVGTTVRSAATSTAKLNGVVYVDGVTYACSDVGINAAIAALGTGGGTVDAGACTSAGTIASTIVVGANTGTNSHGVKLILPCSATPWNVTATGGVHVFRVADSSEIQGCGNRASLVFVQSSANIADVISFIGNPANSNITNYAKISNLWIENDNSGATIANGLINLQNAYDSVIENVKLGGYAPCLFFAADTSSTVTPNADEIYNLLTDGLGDSGTTDVCIQSNHGAQVGPIRFIGGDFGHPGAGKNVVQINTPAGSGFSIGISFRNIYVEGNSTDTTTPLFAVSNSESFSIDDVYMGRTAMSAAYCVSLSDTLNVTNAIDIRQLTCSGQTSSSNAFTSSIAAAPSVTTGMVTEYTSPGAYPVGYASLNGVLNVSALETGAPSGLSNYDVIYADSTAHQWKKIENNGAAFTVAGTLSGTTGSIGGSALTAGQCASGTVSVANSTTAMTVSVSPNTYPGDGFIPWGYVSASGTVTVKVCAQASGTPSSSTYNVRVIQ